MSAADVINSFRAGVQDKYAADQKASQNKFKQLATQYVSSSPEQRDSIGAQLYGIDPAGAEKLVGFTQQQNDLRAADAARQAKQTAFKLYSVANAPEGQAEGVYQAVAPDDYQKAIQGGLITQDMQPQQRDQLIRQVAQQHLPTYMAQAGISTAPELKAVGKDQSLVGVSPMGGAPTAIYSNPEQETFKDQAQSMNVGGKPVMAQVGSKGTLRVVPGATPYNKPSIYGDATTNDASKEFAYQTFSETGKFPPGLAPRSDAGKAALLEYISKRAGEDGNTAAQIAAHGQAFTAKQQALKSYASGGVNNKTLQATNTAIAHMDTMVELAGALENKDSQTINKIKNAWNSEFGSPFPGNMDAAAQLVGTEVVKAMVLNGGGQEERQQAAKAFATYKNLDSIKGVVNTYTSLLGGQMDTKRNDFVQGGLGDEKTFDNRFMTPRTRKALGIGDTPQAPPSGPVKVNTPQEAMQLPSGTQFVTPDGRIKVRP